MATCSHGGGGGCWSCDTCCYPLTHLTSAPDSAPNASAPSCTPWRSLTLPTSLHSPCSPTSPPSSAPMPRVSSPLPVSAGLSCSQDPSGVQRVIPETGTLKTLQGWAQDWGFVCEGSGESLQVLSKRGAGADLCFRQIVLAGSGVGEEEPGPLWNKRKGGVRESWGVEVVTRCLGVGDTGGRS